SLHVADRRDCQWHARLHEDRPGGQLPMNVEKQVLDREGFGLTLLMGGDVTADDLNQVVKQQAEGELEDRRFGGAADQSLQMKNLRDLMKDLLDAPTLQVMIEQVGGRIECRIHEVGDQYHVGLTGTRKRDLPDVPLLGMIACSQPAPFVSKRS